MFKWKNQENCNEECEGSVGTHEKSVSLSTVMRNDWDLLTETRNNVKILKIKKGSIEYEFDQRYLKMQMEVI